MGDKPTSIETLVTFLQALQLIGHVYNTDTEFADSLMPPSTELFLTECAERVSMIENVMKGI